MKDGLYSLKMRASMECGGSSVHVSGAEKIVDAGHVGQAVLALVGRGLSHAKGEADHLNLKIERVDPSGILWLDALPVSTVVTRDPAQGEAEVRRFLRECGVERIDGVVAMLEQTHAMRGAMLLDVRTLQRLEQDMARGVRATEMDMDRLSRSAGAAGKAEASSGPDGAFQSAYADAMAGARAPAVGSVKNHFQEALVLATKVAHCPGMCGEICISDDPGYVTGYVASRQAGYRRITCMKKPGSENGGRIFLWNGDDGQLEDAIRYLQERRVIVRGVPQNPDGSHAACGTEEGGARPEPDCPFPEEENVAQAVPAEQGRPGNAADGQAEHDACPGASMAGSGRWNLVGTALEDMRRRSLHRTMTRIDSAQGPRVRSGGRGLLLMASNSYLDLTAHPALKKACVEALEQYGFGSGGSRLVSGNTGLHEDLEREIARFKGVDDAVVFSTGYVANLACIQAVMRLFRRSAPGYPAPVVFSDELNHASIIDGCRISGARCIVYRHNDMADLREKIEAAGRPGGLVVSDAVFSMDGDILNLPEFLDICNECGMFSMVDEAHSTGTMGATGHGIVEHFGCGVPDILMGTLSKSVGGEGGFIAGRAELADYLRNAARGFIFSTALSPVSMAADLAGLRLIGSGEGRRRVKALQENVRFFRHALNACGVSSTSCTPIFPIVVGAEEKALEFSRRLLEQGFLVTAIRHPTVPKGTARLRVALMATHGTRDLQRLAECIAGLMHGM